MSHDAGMIVQLALVSIALICSVTGLVRDRRERRRVSALFEANAAQHATLRNRDSPDALN